MLAYTAHAQVSLSVYSHNYVTLSSYLGVETDEAFNRFHIQYQGTQINYPNWSVSVRLLQPIMPENGSNVSGQAFPAEKISFRFTLDDNQEINLNSIGANRNPQYLRPTDPTYMIQRAQYPIQIQAPNNTYKQANLQFSFKVDGGKHLDDYKNRNIYSPIVYTIPLLFTLHDERGTAVSSQSLTLRLQIAASLQDGNLVDVEPDYGISILSEANNATLNFRTQRDYEEGVNLRLNDAVKINAKNGFELRIKALSPEFAGQDGQYMPLSTVGLQLTPGTGARAISRNPFVKLSPEEQTILVGESDGRNQAQHFHIDYKGALTRDQLRSVRTGAYSISLMYLLIPR